MKILMTLLISILSVNCFALFDDKMIEPYLGPYKINKNITKNCPSKLFLMASCTLSQLALKNVDNFAFDYINFKGINEGEMITKIGDMVVGKSSAILKDLVLVLKTNLYFSRDKSWKETEINLRLLKKKFHLKKFQRMKIKHKRKLVLDCEYQFGEEESKKSKL